LRSSRLNHIASRFVECTRSQHVDLVWLNAAQVHKGLREEFGEPYREGDVIGCLLHLPLGGRPLQSTRAVRLQGLEHTAGPC